VTSLEQILWFLAPYEFSPTVLAVCALSALLYYRGRRGASGGGGRAPAFWLGLALMYGALQTHYDYYAQHMFFLHRLQHLVLHHLAPFLIAVAAPSGTLAAGLPPAVRRDFVTPLYKTPALNHFYRAIQQPLVAALLFVGLIYLWLIPGVHFLAMLNVPLYDAMNWSMALDGLLFWWMVFNLRAPNSSDAHHYGGRILLLFLVMLPQIVIGAHIALSHHDLYAVYAVCGRIWPLSAQVDQQIGGLITWIPSAMMSIVGALVLLRRWMNGYAVSAGAGGKGGEECQDAV
jgi:putative membrane protein